MTITMSGCSLDEIDRAQEIALELVDKADVYFLKTSLSLSNKERDKIAALRDAGHSINVIARTIGRSNAAVHRELQRDRPLQRERSIETQAAIYTLSALLLARPLWPMRTIARHLGFKDFTHVSRRLAIARNSRWWDETLARKVRDGIVSEIGVNTEKLVQPEPPCPEPDRPIPKVFVEPPPRPKIIARHYSPLRDGGELPAPRSAPQRKAKLSLLEREMNAYLFSDPPPGRSALDQRKPKQ